MVTGSVFAQSLLTLSLLLASPHPSARIVTGLHPCGAAATPHAVWVANDGAGTLVRIDPRRNRVARRIAVGAGACEVASGFGAVWVANYRTASLVRVDPSTNRVRRIRVGSTPFDVVAAAGAVWTTAWRDGALVQVDPATLRVVRRIAVGAYPTGLLFRGGSLWVGFGRSATEIARIDPVSGSIVRIEVGVKAPSHFVATANGIWVVNDGDALVHIEDVAGRVVETVHFGRTLVQPATSPDGTIWVPDKEAGSVFRFDPASGRVVDSFPAGAGAYTALRAFGSMWVTSYAGDDVWRFRS